MGDQVKEDERGEQKREEESLLKKSTREGKNWQRAACVCGAWWTVGLGWRREKKGRGGETIRF